MCRLPHRALASTRMHWPDGQTYLFCEFHLERAKLALDAYFNVDYSLEPVDGKGRL